MVWVIALVALAPASAPASGSAETWRRWEAELRSSRTYAMPCADVSVSVSYEGPSGRRFTGLAFWDGGDTFRLRAAFPTAGIWRWRTYLTIARSMSPTPNLHGEHS
ncbi:MAG TPA: DUF5060 domain-containing protein [Chthonomonadales bacterium]|nr:DUF5060 domain-containing protein [Chthonomonadales bacterium]